MNARAVVSLCLSLLLTQCLATKDILYSIEDGDSNFFDGEWDLEAQGISVIMFSRNSGTASLRLVRNLTRVSGQISIKDGTKSADWVWEFSVDGSFDPSSGVMIGTATPILPDLARTNRTLPAAYSASAYRCPFFVNMTFNQIQETEKGTLLSPAFATPQQDSSGTLTSTSCQIQISINTQTSISSLYLAQVIAFTVVVSVFSIIEIVVLKKQMTLIYKNIAQKEVALFGVVMKTAMDVALIILLAHAQDVVLRYMLVVAAFRFALIALQLRHLWNIIKTKPFSFERFKVVAKVAPRFFPLPAIAAVLYYFQGPDAFVSFVLFSFWVPQVVFNVATQTCPIRPLYIIVSCALRLSIILYFLGASNNFLNVQTNYVLFAILLLHVLWQCVTLVVHFKRVNKEPEPYNYHRPIPSSLSSIDIEMQCTASDNSAACAVQGSTADCKPLPQTASSGTLVLLDCAICMSEVEGVVSDTPDQPPPIGTSSQPYMITPCNHVFHDECLRQWMKINLVCPVCRTELPKAPPPPSTANPAPGTVKLAIKWKAIV